MITTVIVDDHPIVRAGMRTILESAGDIQILAEGVSGSDAIRLVDELRPDVLVLDVQLTATPPAEQLNGLQVARLLKARNCRSAILILTAHDDSQTIFGLLESGAIGYVLKDEALETLVNAVRFAARGETWLSPSVARQVVRRAIQTNPDLVVTQAASGMNDLTTREEEILHLLAIGLDNTSIAEKLNLTKRTVQNHISNIYGKLGVTHRSEAVVMALQNGFGRPTRRHSE